MIKIFNRENIYSFFKNTDKKNYFIAISTVLMIMYYINPLVNVGLKKWNRTFSSAVLSGISINKRTGNFYILFLVVFPVLFFLTTYFYNNIFKEKEEYKKSFFQISIVLIFPIIAAYISRFAIEQEQVNPNKLIQTMIVFQIILIIISFLDKKYFFCQTDILMLCVAYMIAVIASNILLCINFAKSILSMAVIFLVFATIFLKGNLDNKIYLLARRCIFILMWLPLFVCIFLELLFFLNEKGIQIMHYYTVIDLACIFFIVLAFVIAVLFGANDKYFRNFGYVGAILGLCALKYFSHTYQYVWSYSSYANVYELGNASVSADTILNGKLPVIDYFSAHALSDVWTRILYCITHSDIKGIFANPYGGLSNCIAMIFLFLVLKKLFNCDIAALLLFLFPFDITGIKVSSMCFISVVMFIYILDKNNIKQYIFFWLSVLTGAFTVYDEGINLGISCIIAFLIIMFIKKEKNKILKFILSGCIVGILSSTLYFIYCGITGTGAFSRIEEWISVSAASSSSWATANFGDASSFAFLVSYFFIPVCAVSILFITVIKYMLYKKQTMLASLVIMFSITEILYITRSIVYHNLAVCAGRTGVLLNFVHWTVSIFVIYILRNKQENKYLIGWVIVWSIVVIAEGALVTGQYPSSESSLYNSAVQVSESVELKNDMSGIWNKERIIFDDETDKFVNQFKKVFDLLLKKEETFLDFANITSLYVMTGRERPFYVGQSPSLLTDLYSQKCYINEISKYNIPLTILGTTDASYIQQMISIPHNIRYYKIAEYIYKKYRPLVLTGDFAIWCLNENYEKYKNILNSSGLITENMGYTFADYGYDKADILQNENGETYYSYKPYHQYNLGNLSYIWANYDNYNAINNKKVLNLETDSENTCYFKGSQSVICDDGNYIAFRAINNFENNIQVTFTFEDSSDTCVRFEYSMDIIPGTNYYLIRVSQDYFWSKFNIDRIYINSENCAIDNLKILEGD